MGNCLSGGAPKRLIQTIDGNEDDYHNRFMEDQVLGEGEFGQVRMVHDMKQDKDGAVPLACKLLRKGVVFKDNTLYSPIKPAVLRGEVEMLRVLAGKEYCMKLVAIYETPRVLYMVTEYCGGGEMMEYVSHLEDSHLTIQDVSRISHQLLSAIDHCAKCKIIHRDVKPENVMFQDPTPTAEIRLIDFGSGTFIHPTEDGLADTGDNDDDLRMHTTFAGSAFYISPEMFQRKYTYKTDVWSAGATIYVLVAGYPADKLQKAFNIMQTSKHRKLKELPGLPLDDLPASFFTLLDGLLTYRHKHRPTAGEMKRGDFCQLHLQKDEDLAAAALPQQELSLEQVAAAAAGTAPPPVGLSLAGTAGRHALFLGFKKYERSLTALLAAVLSKQEFAQLLNILKTRQQDQTNTAATSTGHTATSDGNGDNNHNQQAAAEEIPALPAAAAHEQKTLSVIPVSELQLILEEDICNEQVLSTMAKLPGADLYHGFAYHVALLREFASTAAGDDFLSESSNMSASGRKRLRRRTQLRRNLSFTGNPGGIGGSARGGNVFGGGADDSSHGGGGGGGGGGSLSGSVSGGRRGRNKQRKDSGKTTPNSVSGGRVFAQSTR